MVCLLLALCVLVSYFQVDALLLTFIAKVLKGTLGYGYFLAAPALLAVAVIQLRHQGRPVILRTTCTLLVPLLSGMLCHLLLCRTAYELGSGLLPQLWKDGQTLTCGGVVAGGLALGSEALLSKVVSVVVFVVLLVAALLGACMGSFLNCMAWRVVHGESVLRGRSHCDVCGHVLTAGDLIPVVSYLVHRGRCRWCGANLSARHVWGEAAAAVTFTALLLRYDISLQMLEALLLACVLLACAFADLEGYIIPDRFVAAGAILRIPFFFLLPDPKGQALDALLGSLAVGGGLLAVVLLYEKLRKTDAMGGGDIKLLCLTGLYLGWMKNLLCLLLACVLGIVFALVTLKRRGTEGDARLIRWGPSISAAAILTLLWGDAITAAYLSLF